jgi:hypothetical protein
MTVEDWTVSWRNESLPPTRYWRSRASLFRLRTHRNGAKAAPTACSTRYCIREQMVCGPCDGDD